VPLDDPIAERIILSYNPFQRGCKTLDIDCCPKDRRLPDVVYWFLRIQRLVNPDGNLGSGESTASSRTRTIFSKLSRNKAETI